MIQKMAPIISAEVLKKIAGNPDVVIVDSSYPKGSETFLKEHIRGGQFVDLDTDLANIKSDFALGGRHPLPHLKTFVKVLNRLGISNTTHVVIYDRNSGAFAARMWWMLRSLGHANVQILDGGFEHAKRVGVPMEKGVSSARSQTNYHATNWNGAVKNMEEVASAIKSGNQRVIDVRGAARYRGESEPIDLIAGHIPGAINIPFSRNLNAEGVYKSAKELQEKYAHLLDEMNPNNVIFHCGSGVTACHTIVAFEIAGFEPPSLYVGSWSEWSRNNNSVVTHE